MRHAWYVISQCSPPDSGALKGWLPFPSYRIIRGSVISCNSKYAAVSKLKTSVSDRSRYHTSCPGLDRISGSVQFLTPPRTQPAWSWQGCHPDPTKTHSLLAGLNPDHGSILQCHQHCVIICIWVRIVSWHDQYIDRAAFAALQPPPFRFVIRPIFVESLRNNMKYYVKFAGFS